MTQKFLALTEEEEWLANQIVEIAFLLHRELGPGLLESVYEKCLCYELGKRGIPFVRQQNVTISYNDLLISDGLRLDVLVKELVIIELKAKEVFQPVWEAQLLSYLKLANKRIGFILNFNMPLMKWGIKRMIR